MYINLPLPGSGVVGGSGVVTFPLGGFGVVLVVVVASEVCFLRLFRSLWLSLDLKRFLFVISVGLLDFTVSTFSLSSASSSMTSFVFCLDVVLEFDLFLDLEEVSRSLEELRVVEFFLLLDLSPDFRSFSELDFELSGTRFLFRELDELDFLDSERFLNWKIFISCEIL